MLIAACHVALLPGCARYQPEPLSPAVNARLLEGRSLDDPRLRQFITAALAHDGTPAPPLRWHLTTLTLAALYYQPDIRIAQARLAQAAAAEITAHQWPNPTLRLTNVLAGAAVAGAIPAGAAPITIGPVIEFMLETSDKRIARSAQARHLAEAARFDIATAEWQVRGKVRDALLELWATEHRLSLARQQRALQQQLVRLMQQRVDAGQAAAPDVARERINQAQTVLAIGDLDRVAAEAHAKLAAAIGVPEHGLDAVQPDLALFDHPVAIDRTIEATGWRRTALTERSNVRASLADYAAAEAALRLAVAGQYPDLTFGPGYNYDLGVNRYVLDVGATLPVLNQNQGPIAEAAARRQVAAAAFDKVQATVIAAIDAAEADYRGATQAMAAAAAMLREERRRGAKVEDAFRAGQVDRPSLVSARLVRVTAEQALLNAEIHQRQALGALEDALQRPLYEPDTSLSLRATAVSS